MDVRFGVHAGLQHTRIAELQRLWARIEELGFDWISIWDHFYAADAPATRTASKRSRRTPRSRPTTERVHVRFARVLRGLPPPRGARQRDGDARPGRGRPRRARPRRRLARRTSTTRTACTTARPASGCACSSEYIQCVRGLLTQERTTFDGEFFTLARRAVRAEAGAGAAADLDRRRRREGDAAHRRRARRRLERAVHPARRVGAQGRRCSTSTARRSGAIRPTITKTVNVGMAFTDEELQRAVRPRWRTT